MLFTFEQKFSNHLQIVEEPFPKANPVNWYGFEMAAVQAIALVNRPNPVWIYENKIDLFVSSLHISRLGI